MAKYESAEVAIKAPIERVFETYSNFENLRGKLAELPLDQIPADKRDMFEKMEITEDSITIPGSPVGPIRLQRTELVAPTLIRLQGVGLPVGLDMEMQLKATSPSSTAAKVVVDLAIPAMLKPMVGGMMQQVVDQFAQVMRQVPVS